MSGAAIVGAGDYIGAAIARKFAAEGYTVFLGRRHGEKLAPLVADIEARGGRAVGRSLDARKEDDITVFLRDADAAAPLDVCIFNVGANVSFPLVDTTERVFRKVWEMACYGGFLTGREAARLMLARGRGSLFFTGATASLRGGQGYAAFASAKAGLAHGGAKRRARARAPQHPRRAPRHRRRRRHRVGARAHRGACGRRRGDPAATRHADATGGNRRRLLAPPPATARRVDLRARDPALRGDAGERWCTRSSTSTSAARTPT